MTRTPPSPHLVASMLVDARALTLALVADLTDEQLWGPRLPTVNPLLWEIGHLAWFHEKWALRHLRNTEPILPAADVLYDSAAVAHDSRWDLPLPSRNATLAYMAAVLETMLEHLDRLDELSEREAYFHLLGIYHEDMHEEAFTYTRQTLGYAAPRPAPVEVPPIDTSHTAVGDVVMPGGIFPLGATPDLPFVFDNEQWSHPVEVRPYAIARTAVTQGAFAEFVDSGGYRDPEHWSSAGWSWVQQETQRRPLYWQLRDGGRWFVRRFDVIAPLQEDLPIMNVSWYEAEAYCRWARRRLPTEAEWEMAACGELTGTAKRGYPWGDDPPSPLRANLDGLRGGTVPVGMLPDGDSGRGCRQLIGNVWEWTADAFLPFQGFVAGPYKEYSEPWFGSHKVLRGGSWATRGRLIRNTWRNFYMPDRRDVWAGFRTCAP